MQKLLSVLLCVLLIFSLCSCIDSKNPTPPSTNGLPVDSPLDDGEKPNGSGKNNEGNTDGGGSKTPNPQTPQNNQGGSNTPPNSQPQTPSSPTTPETQIPVINEIVYNHTALTKTQYYQYSFLSDTEKSVYNELYSAAEKCQNIVNLTKYKLSEEAVKKVYAAFIADCPQYFYISKYCTYIITSLNNSSDEIVTEFILQYTDGAVTDTFDNKNTAITLADRQKINTQIIEFANKINAILSHIPANISELERERMIYEYITDTVIYDSVAEETVKTNPNFESPSFSAYGAACKGTAVCEGYVRFFQYLCYNSGINVTPVESGKDMQHMWAAVKIDNNWYMADITWDDTDSEFICTYKYFNVTTLQMSADHSFGNELKIPLCNSDKASFHNNFALIPENNNPPKNYKEIIKKSDKYIYIYRGKNSADLEDFINDEIYGGEIGEFVESLGYTLGEQYYHNSKYYYIPIIK